MPYPSLVYKLENGVINRALDETRHKPFPFLVCAYTIPAPFGTKHVLGVQPLTPLEQSLNTPAYDILSRLYSEGDLALVLALHFTGILRN